MPVALAANDAHDVEGDKRAEDVGSQQQRQRRDYHDQRREQRGEDMRKRRERTEITLPRQFDRLFLPPLEQPIVLVGIAQRPPEPPSQHGETKSRTSSPGSARPSRRQRSSPQCPAR